MRCAWWQPRTTGETEHKRRKKKLSMAKCGRCHHAHVFGVCRLVFDMLMGLRQEVPVSSWHHLDTTSGCRSTPSRLDRCTHRLRVTADSVTHGYLLRFDVVAVRSHLPCDDDMRVGQECERQRLLASTWYISYQCSCLSFAACHRRIGLVKYERPVQPRQDGTI